MRHLSGHPADRRETLGMDEVVLYLPASPVSRFDVARTRVELLVQALDVPPLTRFAPGQPADIRSRHRHKHYQERKLPPMASREGRRLAQNGEAQRGAAGEDTQGRTIVERRERGEQECGRQERAGDSAGRAEEEVEEREVGRQRGKVDRASMAAPS